MEPMKLNIQLFAAPDPDTILINLYFKDIVESELPESLIFSFDGEQVTIPISGVSMNYVWNYWGSSTFNSITILSEGYLIIPYQIGNGIVDIDIYKNFSFVKKILEDNTINQTTPDFSQVATTNEGMFADFDNEGVTTYFRGAVTNNYVKFANFWWRIIRVNGNGSVRLIYDGTTAHANGESSTDRHIGTSAFNTNNNDNAYVGYMYGTPGSTTYEATHANVNNSAVKTTLDNWYESNLSNYSDYIDTEAGFWGDRTPYSGSGTGTTRTYYAADNRLFTNKTPSFECANNSDLYTTTGSEDGNKALQYPIGLITADEVMYAGGTTSSNNSYYLYTGQHYWTMSPYYFNGRYALVCIMYSIGALNNLGVDFTFGVRPVINLRGDLSVTGTGTSTDPYEVSLPAVPTTNFNGTELTDIYYNGTALTEVYFNNVLVFSKQSPPYSPNLRTIQVGDAFWEGTSLTLDIPADTNISEYSKIVNGADISIEANPNPQMIAFLCDRGNTVAQLQIFYPDLGINIGKISDLDFRSPETPSYKVQDTITSINANHEIYPHIRVDTATLYRDGVVLVRYYDLDDNYIFKDFDTWADFYSWCYANKNNIHAIEIYTYGTTDTIFFNDLFSGSTSIISVDLQHMRDISGTVSCAHAFENCPNLEFFRCGEFEIQSAAYMFYNDTALNDCMLGYCKGIHNLEQTWAHCSSLTEISLLNETTGETVSFTNVGSMEDAFYNSGLTNFDFHYWTNPTLNTLGTTFSNTSSSLVVDFYNLNIEDVAMQGVNQINGSGTAKFFAPVSFDYTVIDFLFSDWRVSYYDKHGYITGPTGEPAA